MELAVSRLLVNSQAHLTLFILLDDVREEAFLVYGILVLLWGLVRELVEVFGASERNTHFQEDALDDALLLLIQGANNVPLDKFLALFRVWTLHT